MSDVVAEFFKVSAFLFFKFFDLNSNVTLKTDHDFSTKFRIIIVQNFEKILTLEL